MTTRLVIGAIGSCLLAATFGCKTTVTKDEFVGVSFDQQQGSGDSSVLDSQLKKLESLSRTYPKRPDLHYKMAGVHCQKENLHDAAKSLQRAIYLDPGDSKYHYHLGRLYMRMHELEKAEKALRRAVELMPRERYTGGHAALGYVLCQTGRMQEARAEFETCTRIDPEEPNSYYFLGCIDDAGGRRDSAVANFKEYLARGGQLYRTRARTLLLGYGIAVPADPIPAAATKPSGEKIFSAKKFESEEAIPGLEDLPQAPFQFPEPPAKEKSPEKK